MSDDLTFQSGTLATVPSGTIVETIDQGGGVQRQVVAAVLDQTTPGANVVNHATTGIGSGKKVVATAGTDLVLAGSTAAKWVTIQAYRINTGIIAVGAAGVDASAVLDTGTGVTLAAGESITMPIDNLADVFVDATVSGEGVRYTYGS